MMKSLQVVSSRRILGEVPASPPEEQWVYQSSRIFQLSATQVGLMTQIRPGGARVVDLSYGNDLWILSDPGKPLDGPVPIDRPQIYVRPEDGKRFLLSMHWSKGAFVPLGAKRADGTPHPAAGTGFGGSIAAGYPPDFEVLPASVLDNIEAYEPCRGIENPLGEKSASADTVRFAQVHQYRYDGNTFRVTRIDSLAHDFPEAGEWIGHSSFGLRSGIPDGDDILFPLTTGRRGGQSSVAGVGRWVFEEGGWRTSGFVEVPGTEACFEPSLERAGDGSLLFTCRSFNKRPATHSIRVWRSIDGGAAWELAIDVPDIRASSPVTINCTADGQPYILGNPWKPGMNTRDCLAAWPLTADCDGLLPMEVLLDSSGKFGLLGGKYHWTADHPVAAVVRLADGKWHNLFAHRFANRLEIGFDLPPTPLTGTYLGEIISEQPALPVWNF